MISSLDQLVAAAKQELPFFKPSMASKAAGAWQSLWTAAGQPAAGSAPGAAAIPTSATAGALLFSDPVAALTYLSTLQAAGGTIGTLVLYDRLAHASGLSGVLTTAQAVNTPALTRCVDGIGVEAWLEWYTATGATASNVTASYTNTDDTAGRTTVSQVLQATPVAGQMQKLPLAAGDKGVKSLQTVTLSASTATAGNFGVTLLKQLATIPLTVANIATVMDAIDLGLPKIDNGACLALMVLCSTTNTGAIFGKAQVAQG